MSVYFIQASDHDPIKIGVANRPRYRLMTLQTSHWETLHIVRTLEGGSALERWLHRRFANFHIRGEWFQFCPEMLTIIPPTDLAIVPDIEQIVAQRRSGATWHSIAAAANMRVAKLKRAVRNQFDLAVTFRDRAIWGSSHEVRRQLRLSNGRFCLAPGEEPEPGEKATGTAR